MSDIPRARELLELAVEKRSWATVQRAVTLMHREKPSFVSPRKFPALTREQQVEVRRLRREGWSQGDLVKKFDTNIGRISKAINK